MIRMSSLRLIASALVLGSAATLISCYQNTPANNTAPIPLQPIQLTASLTGQQVKPTSTTSTATGTFTGSIDRTTRVMNYTLVYSGLTPTAGRLHRVTNADGTGPAMVAFSPLTTPITGTTPALQQSRIDSMTNGLWYAILPTSAFPLGEIRGDIRVR